MLRWYLFAAALVVVAFSFLTVVKSPDWSQWRFAVLAGEYGHWFALGALALVGLAGNFSRPPTVPVVAAMLLGLVAHRAGKKLEYDPATGRVTNMNEANDYLKRTYRPNWTLNG